MDFVTATDRLAECPSHDDVAAAIGVSVHTVRQARLAPDMRGHRTPPAGWQAGIAQLARERAADLVRLADELEGEGE